MKIKLTPVVIFAFAAPYAVSTLVLFKMDLFLEVFLGICASVVSGAWLYITAIIQKLKDNEIEEPTEKAVERIENEVRSLGGGSNAALCEIVDSNFKRLELSCGNHA